MVTPRFPFIWTVQAFVVRESQPAVLKIGRQLAGLTVNSDSVSKT